MSKTLAFPPLSKTSPAQIVNGCIIADVGTTVWIPIEFFVPNPDQPRKWFDPDELQATAESYEHRGDVEDAVKVVLRNDGMIAFIVDGESRWRAAQIVKLAGLSAYIMAPMSDDEIYLSSAVANIRRRDFSIIEKALAIFEIQQRFKLNQAEAGRKLGYKPAQTTYLLGFLDLIDEIQIPFMQGRIGAGIARQLASYPPEEQKDGLKAIMQAVQENDGKPIHHNKAARVIRKDMENRGVQPKTPSRGRSPSSHGQLVAKNLLAKLKDLQEALQEFASLDQKAIKDLQDPHFLDVENALQGSIRSMQKQLGRLSRQT